jgi:hypothetical protein
MSAKNEYFYSPITHGKVVMTDPLELDKYVILEPDNWICESENVITTIIKIKAMKKKELTCK